MDNPYQWKLRGRCVERSRYGDTEIINRNDKLLQADEQNVVEDAGLGADLPDSEEICGPGGFGAILNQFRIKTLFSSAKKSVVRMANLSKILHLPIWLNHQLSLKRLTETDSREGYRNHIVLLFRPFRFYPFGIQTIIQCVSPLFANHIDVAKYVVRVSGERGLVAIR